MEGTNKAHKNGEAMGLVGVRLTDQLGPTAAVNMDMFTCAKHSSVISAAAGVALYAVTEDFLRLLRPINSPSLSFPPAI